MPKLLKNAEKYFQRQFWKVRHAQNIIQITSNERGDELHVFHIHYFIFSRMLHPSKLMQNKVIIIQIMLEFKIFLNIYEKKIKMETKLFYSK